MQDAKHYYLVATMGGWIKKAVFIFLIIVFSIISEFSQHINYQMIKKWEYLHLLQSTITEKLGRLPTV